jgi:hypothetical protein
VGYDGFKHGKWTKIHACVNRDSMPLIIGPGNDSKKILELIGGLEAWSAICGRIIRYGTYKERLRIYGYRAEHTCES